MCSRCLKMLTNCVAWGPVSALDLVWYICDQVMIMYVTKTKVNSLQEFRLTSQASTAFVEMSGTYGHGATQHGPAGTVQRPQREWSSDNLSC